MSGQWAEPFDASPPGGALIVVGVPAFSDNILWLLHEPVEGATVAVDPGDAAPVMAEADRRGWRIDAVWNTHWHGDHSGGNLALKAAGARVIGPAGEGDRIPGRDMAVADGDRVRIGALEAEVWSLPGHTAGHVGFVFREAGAAFVGDTMFAMGCGRLFEGTAEQMWTSLRRIGDLPPETMIYCAHEYTLSNARFSAAVRADDAAVAERLRRAEAVRQDHGLTVPTTLRDEWATNLFLRANSVEEFAALRSAKDQF